jgi:hypothetical protein
MDADRLRRLIEKFTVGRALEKRRRSLVMARTKNRLERESAEIELRLDDVSDILGKPKDDPQVLAVTAFTLAHDERDEEPSDDDGDPGYPTFNW